MNPFDRLCWWKFAPDKGDAAGGASVVPTPMEKPTEPAATDPQASAAPATPTPEPAPATEPAATTDAPAATDPGSEPAPAPTAAQQQASAVREFFQQQGLDVTRYGDDKQILQTLLEAARQGGQYREAASRYMQLAPQFEQWQREQAQRQQQAQQEKPKSLLEQRPEFDPTWLTQVERDPATGVLKARQGAPSDVVGKVQAFADWQTKWDNLFRTDPAAAIAMASEHKVNEIVQQRLAQQEEFSYARNFESQNADWIWAKGGDGKPMMDRAGNVRLSPAGQVFANFVLEAAQLGIQGTQKQYAYATRQFQAECLLRQQQRQPAPAAAAPTAGQQAKPGTVNDQKKRDLLNGARRPNTNGAQPANGTGQPPTPESTRGLRFGEKLALAFADKGDDYFATDSVDDGE